jgi:hypothetical protein
MEHFKNGSIKGFIGENIIYIHGQKGKGLSFTGNVDLWEEVDKRCGEGYRVQSLGDLGQNFVVILQKETI